MLGRKVVRLDRRFEDVATLRVHLPQVSLVEIGPDEILARQKKLGRILPWPVCRLILYGTVKIGDESSQPIGVSITVARRAKVRCPGEHPPDVILLQPRRDIANRN